MLTSLSHLDQSLLLFLNNAFRNPVLDWLLPFISTNQYVWLLPGVVLAVYLIVKSPRTRWVLLGVIAAVSLTDALTTNVLKPLFGRPRPYAELDGIMVYLHGWLPVSAVKITPTLSFPSAHAANSTAVAVMLGASFPKARLWLALMALLICYSRIYMGLHYPGDILGGVALGIVCSGALLFLHKILIKTFPAKFKWATPEAAK